MAKELDKCKGRGYPREIEILILVSTIAFAICVVVDGSTSLPHAYQPEVAMEADEAKDT